MSSLLQGVLRPTANGIDGLSERLANAKLKRSPQNSDEDDDELVAVVSVFGRCGAGADEISTRSNRCPALPASCLGHRLGRALDLALPPVAPAIAPHLVHSSLPRGHRIHSKHSHLNSANASSADSQCATWHRAPASRANGKSRRPSTTVR